MTDTRSTIEVLPRRTGKFQGEGNYRQRAREKVKDLSAEPL
ncbi:unnamed protein product [Acidithrix sp. C25]|nr:unnamed protein product [Acidithrix sp. C25]